jgi:hypothetical protein
MLYDLPLIAELGRDVGLKCVIRSADEVAIELGQGATLLFQNSVADDDCLTGFEDTPWHTHGDFTWSDASGTYIQLEYLDVMSCIAQKKVLIWERWEHGRLSDRWLVHRDYVDVFRYLQEGDEIRIRPAEVTAIGLPE